MQSATKDLLSAELVDWTRIALKVVQIPESVFREHGTSGFMLSISSGDAALEYEAQFDALCQSAPSVSRKCISLISMAFGALALMLSMCDEIDDATAQKCLMDTSAGKGGVLAMMPVSPLLSEYKTTVKKVESTSLAKAGSKGGKQKNAGHAALRLWVNQNKSDRMPKTRKAATELVGKLPPHLKSISADPVRFVWDVLREK